MREVVPKYVPPVVAADYFKSSAALIEKKNYERLFFPFNVGDKFETLTNHCFGKELFREVTETFKLQP